MHHMRRVRCGRLAACTRDVGVPMLVRSRAGIAAAHTAAALRRSHRPALVASSFRSCCSVAARANLRLPLRAQSVYVRGVWRHHAGMVRLASPQCRHASTAGSAARSSLRVQVDRVLFYDANSGYTVARARVLSGDQAHGPGVKGDGGGEGDTVTLQGRGGVASMTEGEVVDVEGTWTTHPKYGSQFRVDEARTTAPRSPEAMTRFLASGLFKGVGPAIAKRIVERFGDQTLEVMEQGRWQELVAVKGVSKRLVGNMREAWQASKSAKDLIIFCQVRHTRCIDPATCCVSQRAPVRFRNTSCLRRLHTNCRKRTARLPWMCCSPTHTDWCVFTPCVLSRLASEMLRRGCLPARYSMFEEWGSPLPTLSLVVCKAPTPTRTPRRRVDYRRR